MLCQARHGHWCWEVLVVWYQSQNQLHMCLDCRFISSSPDLCYIIYNFDNQCWTWAQVLSPRNTSAMWGIWLPWFRTGLIPVHKECSQGTIAKLNTANLPDVQLQTSIFERTSFPKRFSVRRPWPPSVGHSEVWGGTVPLSGGTVPLSQLDAVCTEGTTNSFVVIKHYLRVRARRAPYQLYYEHCSLLFSLHSSWRGIA